MGQISIYKLKSTYTYLIISSNVYTWIKFYKLVLLKYVVIFKP